MMIQLVGRKMLQTLMPPNCRYVKKKWVFNIECSHAYSAHMVEYGYSQVPRVDFSENYSLVVNEIML